MLVGIRHNSKAFFSVDDLSLTDKSLSETMYSSCDEDHVRYDKRNIKIFFYVKSMSQHILRLDYSIKYIEIQFCNFA